MAMRVRNLDVGIERISQWEIGDELHIAAVRHSKRALDLVRRPSRQLGSVHQLSEGMARDDRLGSLVVDQLGVDDLMQPPV